MLILLLKGVQKFQEILEHNSYKNRHTHTYRRKDEDFLHSSNEANDHRQLTVTTCRVKGE